MKQGIYELESIINIYTEIIGKQVDRHTYSQTNRLTDRPINLSVKCERGSNHRYFKRIKEFK